MQSPIKRTVERMPGGMMVVPLLAGCIIATFAPDLPKFFGSFTAALFSGALPILAVFYVCMGSTIDLKMTGYIAKKGGSLFATKILLGVILCLIAGHFLGGTLNWASGATAGLLGIGLGLFVVVGSGIFLILTDRVTGGTGTAGLAAATTRECSRGSNARGCSQSGLRQCRQNGNGVDYGCGCHYRSDSAFFHCLVGPTLCQIWRTTGMKDCLILADDLSGAADSAVSALRAGLDAKVFLTAEAAQESSTAVVAFVSAPRPLLMVVKAGGFGDPDTLPNAYRLLKEIRISHE